MRQNAYLLAKIGADTAEYERNFAENLQKIGNYPTGLRPLAVGLALRGAQLRPQLPLDRLVVVLLPPDLAGLSGEGIRILHP